MAIDLLRGAAERANALRAGVILIGGASNRMGTDKSALVLDGHTMLDRTIATISPLVGEILIVGKPGSVSVGNVVDNTAGHSLDSPEQPSGTPIGSASTLGLKPGVDLGALLGNLGVRATAWKPTFEAPTRGLEHSAQTASLTIRRVADRWPGEGPLGGILSAFASTTAMEILVVAVDLPWLSLDSLRALCATPMTVRYDIPNQQGPSSTSAKASKSSQHKPEELAADCVMTLHKSRLQPLHARYTRRCESLMGAQFTAGERSILRCNLQVRAHVASDEDNSSVDVDTPQDWEAVKSS